MYFFVFFYVLTAVTEGLKIAEKTKTKSARECQLSRLGCTEK